MATFRAVIIAGFTRPDGTANIKIRITQKRKSAFISTDLYVRPGDFKKGKAYGINADFINMRLLDLLSTYQRRYLMLGAKVDKLTASEIKSIVRADNANTDISFTDFADDYLKRMGKAGRAGTLRGFRPVVVHVKKFRPGTLFTDIDFQFLRDFEMYMRKQGVTAAIPTYMSKLRVIFNAGRDRYNDEDRGVIRIPNYPFRRYKIHLRKHPAAANHLSVEQLIVLYKYNGITARQKFARDMFLLMVCLIGINTKDLYQLPLPGKNGRIRYRRAKTGKEFSVKVEPEAAEIIGRYSGNGRAVDVTFSDYLHFQKSINEGLKQISKAKEWPRVTTNWARHTWATVARNDCGIDKDTISKALGHSSGDNVTDAYIRYDYSIVDRANRAVLDKIFS